MVPGHKIIAIFGFIAIRNFIDATEILEKKIQFVDFIQIFLIKFVILVMIYANEIAEIVHNVCD